MTDQNNVKEVFTQEDIQKNKNMGIIAYIIFFVPLLVDGAKDSPYVKFHVNQGLLLVLGYVILGIGGFILAFIPFIGPLIVFACYIALIIFHLISLIGAANGQAKKLPLVGDIRLIK